MSGSQVAKVYKNSTYTADITYNLLYAQGLSHSYWNSDISSPVDLYLDVYLPNNNENLRPTVIFIHGGGFRDGDKTDYTPSYFPQYFAERGFVGISINYRLARDYGTIPAELNNKINAMTGLSDGQKNKIKAMYPATRDAKAALRWVSANASQYGIDPNSVSVIGGSAGSFISIALGVSNPEDYTNELNQNEDPTLSNTNIGSDIKVKAVINHWGGTDTVDLLEMVYGLNRWDESDAPISIVHGTEDQSVPFQQAEGLVDIFQSTSAYYEFYPLEGAGHSAWNFMYEGKTLHELSFDFIARMLGLTVEE